MSLLLFVNSMMVVKNIFIVLAGLQTMYCLSQNGTRARFELTDWDGSVKYAEYSMFKVGTEETNYTLSIGGYNGTLCNSMRYHNGQVFTTNDHGGNDCTKKYSTGWWYKNCHTVNWNGLYYDLPAANGLLSSGYGLSWSCYRSHKHSYKKVEIKLLQLK